MSDRPSRRHTLASLAVLFAVLSSSWTNVYAQDRMPAIPADKMTEAQKKAAAEVAPQGTLAGYLRYSGSALGYQLASITAGGPAPIIALFLMRQFGSSLAIAIYISLSAMISLACVYRLPDGAGHLDHQ